MVDTRRTFDRGDPPDEGHQVVTAESARDAVRLCQHRSFDLIITDLSIPGVDGLQLIGSLRQSHSNLPVLATSGAFNDALKIATMLGATGTLQKPFSPDGLLAEVGKILGKLADQYVGLHRSLRDCHEGPGHGRVFSISFRIGSTNWIRNFHRNCSTVDRFSSISVLRKEWRP
jgi:two-component system, chemotaxis family, chemotaxis protein CheY